MNCIRNTHTQTEKERETIRYCVVCEIIHLCNVGFLYLRSCEKFYFYPGDVFRTVWHEFNGKMRPTMYPLAVGFSSITHGSVSTHAVVFTFFINRVHIILQLTAAYSILSRRYSSTSIFGKSHMLRTNDEEITESISWYAISLSYY